MQSRVGQLPLWMYYMTVWMKVWSVRKRFLGSGKEFEKAAPSSALNGESAALDAAIGMFPIRPRACAVRGMRIAAFSCSC
jgi:hypothetical protein